MSTLFIPRQRTMVLVNGKSASGCLSRPAPQAVRLSLSTLHLAILLLCLFATARGASAQDWQPSDAFMRAIRFVESSNGRFLIGDEGRSLGDFQLSEAAWLDVNKWRKERRLKTYDYAEHVMHPWINRVYAANYFSILHSNLSQKLGRDPTHGELYAAYNVGMTTFRRCGLQLARVNAVTRAKCAMIEAMAGS